MIYILIAGSKAALNLLELGVGIKTHDVPGILGKNCCCSDRRIKLLIDFEALNSRRYFEDLAAEFSRWVVEDQVSILVSDVRPHLLNPLSHAESGIEPLLAMLILAFPEVHWFFGTIRGYGADDDALNVFRKTHGLHYLFRPLQTPLFDGAGLHDWVRRLAATDDPTRSDVAYVPRRRQLAVAIDEETDYAHLHAYTAYRFGFRALAISNRAAADEVLRLHKKQEQSSPWKLSIVLEDLFLNFPDGGDGLSDLRERHKVFPALEDAGHRILVTSGQRVGGDADKNARNKQYIAEQRANGRNIRFLYKPHAGIFSVWEKSGLDRKLRWNDEYGKVHRGTGEPYIWPPDWQQIGKKFSDSGDTDGSGHSSPGIFLLIARQLLNRAETMLGNGLSSVEEAVHGAVLANKALELLGGKTPTTATEALSLKHQFELHAECQFAGVEHHIPLNQRLKEIKRDAVSIAHWFRPQKRHRAALNIQMNIINQLVCILRQYNQFDEEQVCMTQVRHLHATLWMRERPWRYVFWPPIRYAEILLSSFGKFVAVVVVWILILALLFTWANLDTAQSSTMQLIIGLENAVTSFFSVGIPFQHDTSTPPMTGWKFVVSVLAMISGFLHLGVLISHLYMIISRR